MQPGFLTRVKSTTVPQVITPSHLEPCGFLRHFLNQLRCLQEKVRRPERSEGVPNEAGALAYGNPESDSIEIDVAATSSPANSPSCADYQVGL